MNIRHALPVFAAAVLSGTLTFAQTESPQPSTDSAKSKAEAMPVTLVGCVQREADYRKSQDIGRGGAVNTGLGTGDEFVLVNASSVESGSPTASSIDCSQTTGEAYELTGPREDELKPLVGHVVRITGTREKAEVSQAVGTSGTTEARPTGGFDPLKRDLRLFEVNVNSFEEVTPAPGAAAAAPAPEPAVAAPAPEPAAAAPQTAPATQPEATTAQRELPKTASPLPLIGLFGLFSLAGGLGLRLVRN